METKRLKIIVLFTVFMATSQFAYPQWESAQLNAHFSLPEVALIDIEPGTDNDVHFMVNPGTESGGLPSIEKTTANNLWINYSSSLSGSQNARSIVAEISQGTLPEGFVLFLEASNYKGSGNGQHGHSAGKIEITSQPKPIITNIRNCYTGDGINNGHLLTFSIEFSDYTKVLSIENSSFLVMYTITDN